MKIALFCAAFVAVFALITGETCRRLSDCGHVTCNENDYVLECHNFQCTCTHTSQGCKSVSECNDPDCHRTMHCVDNKCRCGFGITGGLTGGK